MYKRLVKDMKNPFIHMELNLKESQKYAKQGRTYTSSIMNFETLMWFVYEMEQNRTHRLLGIFSACEQETLRIAQDMFAPLNQIKVFSGEFEKMNMSQEKKDVLKKAVQAAESIEKGSYNAFWNMREEINIKSKELLKDAAENDPTKLKNAYRDLNLGELLHTLHDSFHNNAMEMEEALKEIGRIEPDPPWGYGVAREVNGMRRLRRLDDKECDTESLLFSSLKMNMEKLKDSCINVEKVVEKAIAKYERIENRATGVKKTNVEKKEENRASVRGKMELLQMREPKRSGKVAEEKEMMR